MLEDCVCGIKLVQVVSGKALLTTVDGAIVVFLDGVTEQGIDMMEAKALIVTQYIFIEIAIVYFMIGSERVVVTLIDKVALGIVLA